MKLFVKLMITGVVLAVIMPFTIIKGSDGRPIMSLSDLKAPDLGLPKVPDSMELPGNPVGQFKEDVIYQWRDAQGLLHFTSEPPEEGIEYTAKGYDPNANLIQSVKVESPQVAATVEEPVIKSPSDIGNPYSPEKVEKLFEDAKNVQKLLEDRMQQQEAMIGR